mmetsp:Transcript_843/g.1597  ORF Transcript_843/g.1597 Transcript_843/m.1597 type:complete len:164 (+) Transcript_843:56-547(+)
MEKDGVESNCEYHLLPCTIHHRGEVSNAASFFGFKQDSAYFRGRQLYSQSIRLPENYQIGIQSFEKTSQTQQQKQDETTQVQWDTDGNVVNRNDATSDGIMKVSSRSSKLTYWVTENHPDLLSDSLPRALQWIDVAEALHSEVSLEELEYQLQKKPESIKELN